MFFKGTLNEGISKALQEQKLVSCFITDEQEESEQWESWLMDQEQSNAKLEQKAVLLRLVAGSVEAGFLAAFCPIETIPALIIISNGVPIAHLKSGLDQQEFRTALEDALPETKSTSTGIIANLEQPAAAQPRPTSIAQHAQQIAPDPIAPSPQSSTPSTTTNTISTLNDQESADRAARLAQIAKSQSDALAERRRILQQIENDKVARRVAAQEASTARRTSEAQIQREAKAAADSARKNSKECALRIRRFDGSTISHIFESNQNLQDVRGWIGKEIGEMEAPFEFKQVLAPMPNRRISAAEEEESLVSLGLAPNATLVMVPIGDYTNAYEGASSGIVQGVRNGVGYGVELVTGALGNLGWHIQGYMANLGQPSEIHHNEDSQSSPVQDKSESATAGRGSNNARIRTLADQRRGHEDQQLYNGNQLNFQRRKDDSDEE